MKTLRSLLREELNRRLIPELKKRGFQGTQELKGNSLLYNFSRKSTNQMELLNIQFDKNLRPRFVLNLQIDPPDGWDGYMKRGGIMVTGRIKPKKGIGTGSWFRADTPFIKRLLGARPFRQEEVVTEVLDCMHAIEDWFISPHSTGTIQTNKNEIKAQKTGA